MLSLLSDEKKKEKGGDKERGVTRRREGERFHWPLECVSIFRVCSGESLSLCSSFPSFVCSLLEERRGEGRGEGRRELQILYFDHAIVAVQHLKRAKKWTMQGSSHYSPNQAAAISTKDSVIAPKLSSSLST